MPAQPLEATPPPPDGRPVAEVRGPWLLLARVAWLALAALALALFVASLPGRLRALRAVCADGPCAPGALAPEQARALVELGLSLDLYAAYQVALESAVAAGFAATAMVLFWRRSGDWMALFFSATLIAYAIAVLPAPDALRAAPSPWRFPAHAMQAIGFWSSLTMLYLFPDGRFVPRWTRPLAVGWAALTLAWLLFPGRPFDPSDPYTMPTGWFLLYTAWFASGALALAWRYLRVAGPVQRQQIKWVVFGVTVAVCDVTAYVLLPALLPSLRQPGAPSILYGLVGQPLFVLALLLIPLSVLFSILRYRLWDIDVLINRALVYGSLSGTLALVYAGGIVLLQGLFRAMTGQRSNLAVVASTLAIAALFQPLRRRIQAFIDRRFYRRKYDAAKTLAAFSTTLRDETDLELLTAQLVGVVEETMQPAHVSLWLRPVEEQRPAPERSPPLDTR